MDLRILIIVGVMGFAAIVGLGLVFASGSSGGAKASKRLQAYSAGGVDRPKVRTAADPTGIRRKQIQQQLKASEQSGRKVRQTLEVRLRQAGLSVSVKVFWLASGVLGTVVFIIAFVTMRQLVGGLLAGFAAGLGLPRWVLGFMTTKRMKQFAEEFPNAADVIVRGIRSGLPVNDCLKVISRESPEPLASEFRQLVESSAMGVSLERALDKMYERMPTPEVRFFAIVLTIQQKTGGNLAEALNNLSTVLRARKLMVEKIKAMSGEAVASAMIIGCLPPGVMVLVYLTAPTYMSQMFTDPRGHMLLLGGALWMALGIFVMRRMINFKF
jgi:tight adherence protein B